METQTTLVFLKPDASARGLREEIFGRITATGLRLEEVGTVQASTEQINEHYKELRETRPEVFARNLPFFLSGPLVVALVQGPDAVARVRALVGATHKAAPGTIRGDLAPDTIEIANAEGRGLHNLIHASDSVESAQREVAIWARDMAVPIGTPELE